MTDKNVPPHVVGKLNGRIYFAYKNVLYQTDDGAFFRKAIWESVGEETHKLRDICKDIKVNTISLAAVEQVIDNAIEFGDENYIVISATLNNILDRLRAMAGKG